MATPANIRVTGRDGLLSAVPAVLGFHPHDALVVVCMNQHRRLGMTMHMLLPDDSATLTDLIVSTLRRHTPHSVALIAYTDTRPVDLDRLARTILRDTGVPTAAAITTTNTPTPVDADLAAATALTGRTVLADRGAVDASITHTPGAAADTDTIQSLQHQVSNIASRDRLLLEVAAHPTDTLPDLIAALQATPDRHPAVADLAAVTAIAAYLAGDGALANAVLARSHRLNLYHQLSRLAGAAIEIGVTPTELQTMLTQIPRP